MKKGWSLGLMPWWGPKKKLMLSWGVRGKADKADLAEAQETWVLFEARVPRWIIEGTVPARQTGALSFRVEHGCWFLLLGFSWKWKRECFQIWENENYENKVITSSFLFIAMLLASK